MSDVDTAAEQATESFDDDGFVQDAPASEPPVDETDQDAGEDQADDTDDTDDTDEAGDESENTPAYDDETRQKLADYERLKAKEAEWEEQEQRRKLAEQQAQQGSGDSKPFIHPRLEQVKSEDFERISKDMDAYAVSMAHDPNSFLGQMVNEVSRLRRELGEVTSVSKGSMELATLENKYSDASKYRDAIIDKARRGHPGSMETIYKELAFDDLTSQERKASEQRAQAAQQKKAKQRNADQSRGERGSVKGTSLDELLDQYSEDEISRMKPNEFRARVGA